MSYCNDGFGLLSDIVRRHSGYGSFAEYLDKKILKPIGMDRSNISFIRNSQDENAAILYSLENGTWRADRDYQNDAFVLHGGGGMKSTLGDMLKYAVMYLNEGVAGNGNPHRRALCCSGDGKAETVHEAGHILWLRSGDEAGR